MTTTTTPASRTVTARGGYRLNFARALHGEWIKITTLRSTWWAIGVIAVLTVGIAVLIANATNGVGYAGIQAVVSPSQFTTLLASCLGVVAVTGEYSTGMIRSTLAANPIRGSVLGAKGVVVAVLLFVSSLVTVVIAAVAVSLVLAPKGLGIVWADPAESWLPMLAASLSMAEFALIGVAFGFLLRNGAGAIAATIGVGFVLPIVATNIFPYDDPSWQWARDVGSHLPMMASRDLVLQSEAAALSAPEALLTLCGWVVAGMLAAWAVLRTRDA